MVVLAFAPLAFGAVHPWAYGIVWGILWFLVTLWLIKVWIISRKGGREWEIGWVRAWFQPCLMIFALWVIIQCVPIPSSVVGFIQPSTLDAHRLAVPFTGEVPSTLTFSLYPYATRLGIFHLWSYVAVFYLTLYHLKTRKHLFTMAVFWIALGAFEAFYGLTEHLGGTHRIWWWENPSTGGVSGTFINRDHFAGYLEMTIVLAFGTLLALRMKTAERREDIRLGWRVRLSRFFTDERLAKSIPLAFTFILMGTALLLSLSRGATLALVTVLLPVIMLLLFKRTTRWFGVVGLIFFVGVMLYSVPLGLASLLDRFGDLGEDLGSRQELWRDTWAMVKAFPLAGIGLATFEWVFPRFKAASFGGNVLTHAHNEWLEIWAETGFLGVALVFAGFCFYILSSIWTWRKRRDRWVIWLAIGALVAVVIQAAYSLIEFHLRTQAVGMTLAGIMAWGWVLLHHHRRGREREEIRWSFRSITLSGWARAGVFLLLAGIHVIVGAGMALHLLAEAKVPTVRNSTVVRAEFRDIDLLRRAIDFEPTNATRWAWMAREVLRQGVPQPLALWASKKGLRPYGHGADAPSWAITFLQKAIRLNPTSPPHYERLAWIMDSRDEWRMDGLPEEALRISTQLEPANPLWHFRLGQYLLSEDRPEEANEALQEAVLLNPKLQRHVDREWQLFQLQTPSRE
jgi:O-antigen ligase